jgi:hypothetical protein
MCTNTEDMLKIISEKTHLKFDRSKVNPVLKVTGEIRRPLNRSVKSQSEVPTEEWKMINVGGDKWILLDLLSVFQPFKAQIFQVWEL